jgi:hypothetical protein
MPIADTSFSGRQRARSGRRIRYFPTAAEVTAFAAGPWSGVITKANVNRTFDVLLDVPGAAAGNAPAGAYAANEQTVLASLRTLSLTGRKTSVVLSGLPGSISFLNA